METSLGQLLLRHDALLRHWIRRLLGPDLYRSEGEDILQVVRMTAFQALPALRSRDDRSVQAWLKKVVHSRVLDWEKLRRSRKRCPSRPLVRLLATDAPEVAAATPTPSRILMEREQAERLEEAIGAVPLRYRGILRLMARADPGPEEVARFLGKGPEAARKFVARALVHLNRVFKTRKGG